MQQQQKRKLGLTDSVTVLAAGGEHSGAYKVLEMSGKPPGAHSFGDMFSV